MGAGRTRAEHCERGGTDTCQAHPHRLAGAHRRAAHERAVGPGDDPARRERRRRLAHRQRVGTGRVEPVLHGLDEGVHNTDVRVQLKDLREDQRRGCDAEDDRQEDDSLEGRRPPDALGQHRKHQANHGHHEREDKHPDDVVPERDKGVGGREQILVVGEPDQLGRRLVEEAVADRLDGRIEHDRKEDRAGDQERQ